MTAGSRFLRYLFSLPITSQDFRRADLPALLPKGLDVLNQRHAEPILLCHPIAQSLPGGTGLSTSCPSPTLFSLGLGPHLPWADEPSPGNLRFSAGGIRTLLFAYSYRHSLFYSLHPSLQKNFAANRMLPYHCTFGAIHSFGDTLEPRYIFGAEPLDQ